LRISKIELFCAKNHTISSYKYMRHLFNKLLVTILLFIAFGANGQNTIEGKVVDKSSGLSIIGATVVIEGTTNGTLTDIDGKFNFETEAELPLVLLVHFMGYEQVSKTMDSWGQKLKIQMKSSDVMLKAVEVVDNRITEQQQKSPLTVETMDVTAIKEAPSGNFYESLGTLKGVDMTSASLGFKVINTRGFNSTSPVRSLQVIDGVDNQSPGLNFSLGNFLGASDLDVKRVNIVAGASSAYYGPGAFNGVIAIETKSPFLFKGLDASVKFGERDLVEAAIRWADVVKNKKGEDKFGYKLNLFYFSAYDWEAVNYAPQNRYEPWLMQPFVQDSLTSWHADTRTRIDTMPPFGQGVGRYEPGTDRFDSAFSDITGRTFTDGGSLFYDKSALYHIHGEYIFELPENLNITVGANGRLYRPDTRGTIFSDTLQYTYATDSLGERIAIDSSYTKIENSEYGIYIGVQKPLLDNKLTLSATIRMDKNENFDHVFSPAFSAVYAPNKDHVFRATFTSAVRNPTLADQYLYYDVGRAILLGNLNGYDSLVTIESFVDYVNTFNRDTLEYFSLNPIKPERVRSVELGYRGIFWDKLYLDLTGYYSWYYDFIGYRTGIDTELSFFGIPIGTQVYRLATNSDQVVVTRGFSTGVNYYFNKNYSVTFNYSFNELTTAEDDPIIPAYNTPRNKFNIGFQARGINMSILSGLEMGFGANYKWIEGFVFEGSPQFTGAIDSYGLLDAQVNWTWSKINTTLKIGASNVLDNRVYQVYGGPQVGRLAYVSILYSWIKN
jgi:outer membrane receptor protein involved in Fe transport